MGILVKTFSATLQKHLGRKMMKTIKGPALFLAQFAGDAAPFNSWKSITKWAADIGYKGV